MKHFNGLTRIILLMGFFGHGIAINFGPHQFWACKCPPGFYALGTNAVYASAELCNDKNESFIVGPSDFTGDITTPSQDTNNVLTILEACSRCAHGCATCKGPKADECLECVIGYFAHPTQTDTSDVQNKKRKRSSETRLGRLETSQHGPWSAPSQKIYEEDELLVMDGDVSNARDANAAQNSDLYPQNSQHLNEDTMFNDFKDYDDEESSGEVDEDREALEAYISEQSDVSQVPNDDPKLRNILENVPLISSVNLANKDNMSEDDSVDHKHQEPEVTKEEKIDSVHHVSISPKSSPRSTSNDSIYTDQKDTVTAYIPENDFQQTHPIPLVEPHSEEIVNNENKKTNPDEVPVEEGLINTIPEVTNEELDPENMNAKLTTNLKAMFNTVDKDAEPADEPKGNLKNNNISSNVAASTSESFSSAKVEEKSGISGNAISTNINAPLQNLNKVNQQVAASVTGKKAGSALITTASYSCLADCPDGHYNTSNRLCLICHVECEGCFNDGPTNCNKCRNYKKGSTCVASCISNETSTEKYNSNCELQSEDETIPAGYYAIPPLVILFVCACIAISYCKKRRTLKNSLPGRPEGMHKTDVQSSESSFARMHLDQKKCFYKGSKPTSHIALTELKNSSETLKRKVNPYVCAERPLLPKYALQTATQSPAWSACKDMSEPEDNFDPLYETPDNTMDLEGLKRYHYRRRSSPSHVHFALTTLKVKDISNSLEDCLDTDSLRLEDQREYDDVDDLSTENCENQFSENEGEYLGEMEAPYYQAPPLPVRNSPSVQDSISDDHIYVNIDENV